MLRARTTRGYPVLLARERRRCARRFFLAAAFAALALAGAGTLTAAIHATSPPALLVSPTGSDAGPCTRAAPCTSLNRAYAVARPGQTVEVAGGSYPAQRIEWRRGRDDSDQVVFKPSGKVTIQGNLDVYASAVRIAGRATGTITNWRARTYSISVTGDIAVLGDSATEHPHNVTLEGIDGGSLGTYSGENITVRDIDAGPVPQDGNCSHAESKIGPNIDAELFVPRNITWERVVDHGMDLTAEASRAGCHYGGLFIVSADGVTIRDSVFTENVVYNIQVQNYVGAPATNVTIQNSWFGCPVLAVWEAPAKTCNGQASLQFNADSTFSNWRIVHNSFVTGIAQYVDGARYANISVVGNAGAAPDRCYAGMTFSYNAWRGHGCSRTDSTLRGLPFVSAAPGQEDLHLLAGTRASALVAGTETPHVAWDMEHRLRPVRFASDAGSLQRESAEIVPGQAIGGASLGMTREVVSTFYGRRRHSSFAAGIRTDLYRRVHRGTLWLRYSGDRVVALGTTSGYYTTPTGLGPGSPATDARRLLRAKWDDCRELYRRAIGGGIVYLRPDKARRKIVAVSVLRRTAEEPCTKAAS